jgi:hypothetical protein
MTGSVAERQVRRREASERSTTGCPCGGSRRQSPGPRYTKHIEATAGRAREHPSPQARVHQDLKPAVIRIRLVVDVTGGWGEGHASYPERSDAPGCTAATAERPTRGAQKSAEAEKPPRRAARGRTRGAEPARCVRCAKKTQKRVRLRGRSEPVEQAAEPPRLRRSSVKRARHAERTPGKGLRCSWRRHCVART